MPTERITADSHPLTHVRDAARERGRALARGATKLLDLVTTEPDIVKAPRAGRKPVDRAPRPQPYGRSASHREPLLPLEAWLTAGCILMVLWAVGWL